MSIRGSYTIIYGEGVDRYTPNSLVLSHEFSSNFEKVVELVNKKRGSIGLIVRSFVTPGRMFLDPFEGENETTNILWDSEDGWQLDELTAEEFEFFVNNPEDFSKERKILKEVEEQLKTKLLEKKNRENR